MNNSSPNAELERNIAVYYRAVGMISCLISAPLMYAIIFHSGKTNKEYRSFLIVANILNILHDFTYNFSFAPILDETYPVMYSAGGILTLMNVSIGWQLILALFIRLQCACCNFGQLFYRHQVIQPSESNWLLPPWLCIAIGMVYNIFICSVLVPLSFIAIDQNTAKEPIKKEMLPGGAWLLNLPSVIIIPDFGNSAFTVFAILSLIASAISAVLFVLTSRLVINTLNDSRSRLSKTSKRQHKRATAALRMQSIVPLVNVTLPLNIIMLTNSLLPRTHWTFYVLITGMPALQSIFSSLITIYFQTSYRDFFQSLLYPVLSACHVDHMIAGTASISMHSSSVIQLEKPQRVYTLG